MGTLVMVFLVSFVVIAALLLAIVWAMDNAAEQEAWNERQRLKRISETRDAWHGNRKMIMD